MNRTDGTATSERVLQAAYELFSAKGFHATTTQDICSLAQANIAAVNYYYGSKENLYLEVWRHAAEQTQHHWEECIHEDSPPEEQLRQFIAFRLEAALSDDERGWFTQLIHREMSNPGPLTEELGQRYLFPRVLWFQELVRALVGDKVSERQMRLAGFCIHSPLMHLHEMRMRPDRRPPPPDGGPLADPEALADTVYTFALAGLRELRRLHEEPNR